MEHDTLNQAFTLAEGELRLPPRELVNNHRAVCTFRQNGGKVVAAAMPRHLSDIFEVVDDHPNAICIFFVLWFAPLD